MRLQKTIVATMIAVMFATVPAVAFGLTFNLGLLNDAGQFFPLRSLDPNAPFPNDGAQLPNGQTAPAPVADCTIPSGQTTCTAILNIPAGTFASFTILPGATVTATKTSGSVNKITVSNLTIRYEGQFPQRLASLYFHGFAGVDTNVSRAYGQAASGTLCRRDSLGNCNTAAGDIVLLNSTVTYAKQNFTQVQTFSLPQSGPYTVPAGGVSGNNYFPQSVLPSTSGTFACTLGGCQDLEIIGSTLSWVIQPGDSISQKATGLDVGGPNLGVVQNTLNAEAVIIDIQPIFNLDNNDVNLASGGQRQVAVVSQVDTSTTPPTVLFNPNTIDFSAVRFGVGDGAGVPPVNVNVSAGDLNGDGVNDLIFSFNIREIVQAGGACLPGVGGIGVLTGTADFVSTYTTQERVRGNQTVTVTHTQSDLDVPFSGQQSFTCAPSAGL